MSGKRFPVVFREQRRVKDWSRATGREQRGTESIVCREVTVQSEDDKLEEAKRACLSGKTRPARKGPAILTQVPEIVPISILSTSSLLFISAHLHTSHLLLLIRLVGKTRLTRRA